MATTTAWVEKQSNPQVISGLATIDSGETATLAIPCHGRGTVRIGIPSTFTGTAISFTVQPYRPDDPASPTVNPPFRTLKDATGATVSKTVAANELVVVPELSGAYAFTIVSNASEGAARALEVSMVGDTPLPFDGAALSGPGAWRLIAQNTAEQTTTSNSATDLVTLSTDVNGASLTIPASKPLMLVVQYRKTATATRCGIGLKLNTTVVAEASNGANGGIGSFSTTNEAEDGMSYVVIGPRDTNYTHGIQCMYASQGSAAGAGGNTIAVGVAQASMPTAAVTAIAIRAISDGSASVGVKRVSVYVGA